MQLMFNNVEEDVLSARMRRVQSMLTELVSELESRMITRDMLMQKVKDVERDLKKTREII